MYPTFSPFLFYLLAAGRVREQLRQAVPPGTGGTRVRARALQTAEKDASAGPFLILYNLIWFPYLITFYRCTLIWS